MYPDRRIDPQIDFPSAGHLSIEISGVLFTQDIGVGMAQWFG